MATLTTYARITCAGLDVAASAAIGRAGRAGTLGAGHGCTMGTGTRTTCVRTAGDAAQPAKANIPNPTAAVLIVPTPEPILRPARLPRLPRLHRDLVRAPPRSAPRAAQPSTAPERLQAVVLSPLSPHAPVPDGQHPAGSPRRGSARRCLRAAVRCSLAVSPQPPGTPEAAPANARSRSAPPRGPRQPGSRAPTTTAAGSESTARCPSSTPEVFAETRTGQERADADAVLLQIEGLAREHGVDLQPQPHQDRQRPPAVGRLQRGVVFARDQLQ